MKVVLRRLALNCGVPSPGKSLLFNPSPTA